MSAEAQESLMTISIVKNVGPRRSPRGARRPTTVEVLIQPKDGGTQVRVEFSAEDFTEMLGGSVVTQYVEIKEVQ